MAGEERRKVERLDGGADAIRGSPRTEAHVAQRRQVGKESRILRHVPDPAVFRPDPNTVRRRQKRRAVHDDAPSRPRTEPCDGLQE